MQKRIFISIIWIAVFLVTQHLSISAQVPELDLQTLIAGIKHFDAAAASGKGHIESYGRLGQMKETYQLAFDGATFEDAQVRVDFPTDFVETEIWDGERHWEVYRSKALLFVVDISAEDYEHLSEATPKLPSSVKAQLEVHNIDISDDFRIEPDKKSSYSKIVDNATGQSHYVYYTEEQFGFYTTYPDYGVRPQCIIDAQLDPRYWMTYGKITPNAYLMLPLWKLIETYESEILQTEMLAGEETYRVRVKYPNTERLTLWISPEKGFRLVKLQRIKKIEADLGEGSLMKKGKHYLTERVVQYREYHPGVWFPEKIEQAIYPLQPVTPQKKGKRIWRTTLQITKFEVNIDVSGQFQLNVPEDTPVFDYGLAKERPFEELRQGSQ